MWCPTDAAPVASLAAITAQAFRLLPRVTIGSAWTTTALVNAQVILWATTTADRDLGTVNILGTTVALRLHLDHTHWSFGDATADTTTTPGKPYNPTTDPCHTPQCPHYFGHTYTATGERTITLTLTWRAEYRLPGSTWTDLPDPLTGPADQHHLTVSQARGILIPNP